MLLQGEILPYFKYDVESLSKKQWEKDTVKHFRLHGQLKNGLDFVSIALYRELILNDYGFQIEVLNNKPYKKKDCSLVNITLNYCSSSPISTYMDNDMLEDHKANCTQFSIYKPYVKC